MKLSTYAALFGAAVLAQNLVLNDVYAQPPTVSEIKVNVTKPESVLQLLENIKAGTESGRFLEAAFYSETTLVNFFGGNRVTWRMKGDPAHQWMFISDFGPLAKKTRVGLNTFESPELSIERTQVDKEKIDFHLQLSFTADSGISFDSVEALFGKDWRLAEQIPSPHLRIEPATQAHGNTRIEYRAGDDRHSRKITIKFNAAARLENLDIHEIK